MALPGDDAMAAARAAWEWASIGLSGRSHVAPPFWASMHARLMVLGWSVLLPFGMLIARFCKVLPWQGWPKVLDNPLWWRLHVGLQVAGVATMSLGVLLVVARARGSTPLALWHGRLGWSLAAVGWLQVLAAVLRGSKGGPGQASLRGDHFDMTRRRVAFERFHKALGWAALPVAALTTAAGLVMLDAPRWMAGLIGAWWMVILAAFTLLQATGRCIDTYQAIWGPDPDHPGNRRPAIGWGVRRPPVRPAAAPVMMDQGSEQGPL